MSHKYKVLSREDMELVLSTFLIDSWSFSKVNTFARNQKAFEMEYVFGLKGQRSASSIAGNGYHQALAYFFSQYRDGELVELPKLEQAAFEEIGSVPANQWKLTDTLPTMEKTVEKALKDAQKLLLNFYQEKGVYLDDLSEVLAVEQYFDEFLTIDGVDIALPAHGLIDLAFQTKAGQTIVVDHKSKGAYTDEAAAALVDGSQAIVYALGFEALTGIRVDEVWFAENKASQNKSGEVQIQPIKIKMDDNNRRLFEHLLYQNLRPMLEAVSNPDHVYTINTADNFVDKAELLDFCMRTEICEVEDFKVDPAKKDLVAKRLKKIRDADSKMITPQIIKTFRQNIASFLTYDLSATNMTPQEKIEHKLKTFGIMVRVAYKHAGYSSDTFLIEVSAGVKIDTVKRYRLDLANALDVANVRISDNLVVYDDKSYLSVEVDKRREADLIYRSEDREGFKIPVGKDNYGRTVYWDLKDHNTPHALVCGTTGSGKSVFVESTINYALEAGVENIIILDPKNEFGRFSADGVDVIVDILEIEEALEKCVKRMNDRIMRGISDPVLIIFDEYADAIARARKGEKLKIYRQVVDGNYANGNPKYKRAHTGDIASLGDNLGMLLQKGRSSGFRIMAVAQRASTKVIPGDAKNNFPIRICFRVSAEVDSRVVLDEPGAEMLTGRGDGLMRAPAFNNPVRFQAYYKPQNAHA